MKKVMLIIRDGWGYREDCEDNALCTASTPVTDRLMEEYPNVLINASGEAVGLPSGFQGNSEVGHMTIGSGRIIPKSLTKIQKSIDDGSFFKNKVFNQAIDNCEKHGTSLHLIGLLQDEGVHSNIYHLFALLNLCHLRNFHNVKIHAITDGRDAPVTESLIHLKNLKEKLNDLGFGDIVTLSGRYYEMDRDKRWERTRKAYEAVIHGIADDYFEDVIEKVKECHANDETDEFIIPRAKKSYLGVEDNDSLIFFNFRTDRPRQLTRAIVEKDFDGWERKELNVFYVAMTQYYKPMNANVAFTDEHIREPLGEIVSNEGLKQLRISETEKYAHVTFFFNGQMEVPFANEDRILIPSPKVATYDMRPEMRANDIADKIVKKIDEKDYSLVVCNLVNGDMVGHTGIVSAIEKAIEAVDSALGKIVEAGLKKDYNIFVFADHGNVEDQTLKWRTSHTINPVPFILVSEEYKNTQLNEGMGLQNIAPTALQLLGIKKPDIMTGTSLIKAF